MQEFVNGRVLSCISSTLICHRQLSSIIKNKFTFILAEAQTVFCGDVQEIKFRFGSAGRMAIPRFLLLIRSLQFYLSE
jgi:hypothetical protein